MFHFPELASCKLCIHLQMTGHDSRRVSPFRHPRIKECLASPRGLSQLTASFIAFRRQGIHPMLLFACFSRKKLPSIPMQLLKSRPRGVRQALRSDHIRVTGLSHACCQTRHGFEYVCGGAGRDRTDDPRLAKPVLSQLSYSPGVFLNKWWAWKDLNFRPHAYQACALTT